MYEDKSRKTIEIDWKSLLIKLGVLLVVVFLVIWIVSLFSKKDENNSNFGVNLQSMRDAATEYFTGSRLPSGVNDSKKITLKEMFDRNLLVKFQDENGDSCDTVNSYAEATKLDEENYRIEVKLICNNDSDTIINTVKRKVTDSNNNIDDVVDEDIVDENPTDIDDSKDQNDSEQNSSNQTGTTSNSNRPSGNTSGSSKPNNSGTSSNQGSHNNNSGSSTSNTCSYGKKEYSTTYPLAYVVSGNCAVSLSTLNNLHSNSATRVGNTEYTKLLKEVADLEKSTGADLIVSNPQYSKVANKANTGYVGYQIYFSVKQRSTYSAQTIYSYYLDQNGNRKVIIDNRNSLKGNSNSGSSNIAVKSISLNRSSITLDVGDNYTLKATINPSNATDKNISWSSSNSRVATVSSSGKVTAKREGTTTIKASVGGKTASVKVYVNEEKTYRYCSTDKTRVYSMGFVTTNMISGSSTYRDSYQVSYHVNKDLDIIDVEYDIITVNNEYLTIYNYMKNGNSLLALGEYGVYPNNYGDLRDSSLKDDNFSVKVDYVKRVGNTYYFDIDRKLSNLRNIRYVSPYRVTNSLRVYYLPLYLDIISVDYDDCKKITSSQVKKYENLGYVLVD